MPKHSYQKRSTLAQFISLARPKQWLKNSLLLAAPAAAGKITEIHYLSLAVLATITFSLGASGLYMINDAKDVESDRRHPTKKNRPIAAGAIAPKTAIFVGTAIIFISLAISLAINGPFFLAILTYIVITISYTYWLKNEPVLDISIVSFGFLLRAIAGGLATNLPLSVWFLTVAAFGSLFMVSGKRYAEVKTMGDDAIDHKKVLGEYSSEYLNYVRSMASAVAIAGYGLWTFEGFASRPGQIFVQLSGIPFVIAILIYALEADRGLAGSPEEVILGDRRLQIFGAIWALLVAIGIYYPRLIH